MATYGVDDLVVTAGGTDITSKLDMASPANIKTKAILDEYRVAGGIWMNRLASTQKDMDKVVLEFIYEPGGTPDLDDIFHAEGAKIGTSVAMVFTWGGTKTTTVTCIIEDYERIPSDSKLHRSKVTLAPTGAVVEA